MDKIIQKLGDVSGKIIFTVEFKNGMMKDGIELDLKRFPMAAQEIFVSGIASLFANKLHRAITDASDRITKNN